VVLATSTNIYCEQNGAADIPMEESIRMCASAGYRALDFGFVELNRQSALFSKDGWRQEILNFRQIGDNLNVKFVQAHATLYDFCNESSDTGHIEQLMRRSIEGAALLGADWIAVHPSTHTQNGMLVPDTPEINVKFFKALADYAQQFGVGIAIENMWGKTPDGVKRYAIRAEELAELIDAVGRPNVGACWDTEHGSIEGVDQPNAIRLLSGRLKALHISDESGPEHVHILPYMGRISWPAILQALADIGYDNPFTFEIQHYLPGVPAPLVHSAMCLSLEVGSYMIDRIKAF